VESNNTLKIQEVVESYRIEDSGTCARKIIEYLGLLGKRRDWAGLAARGSGLEGTEGTRIAADSVALAAYINESGRSCACDLGAGGGLLGLVVAICCPQLDISLVESASRKAAFLAETIGQMNISNARVLNVRAEAIAGTVQYDVVMSRAAGSLSKLAPIALDLLYKGGVYVALKSSDAAVELEQASCPVERAGGRIKEVRRVDQPHSLGEETRASLVVIEKL
jgi:16S rRNA (guanine527-N7)-methyltransferase